ncbi:MAG: metallophosphoesterase family protein [Lentimicrobium sp.]
MKQIGLLSDTHGVLLPFVIRALNDVDEIWHAGDIGNIVVYDQLRRMKPLRAVHGNIDGWPLRSQCPQYLSFEIEDMKVLMIHQAGSPRKYSGTCRKLILSERPNLLIGGHSHILKVMYDSSNNLLFLNPGAAGLEGIHKVITLLRFSLDKGEVMNMEIIETDRSTVRI